MSTTVSYEAVTKRFASPGGGVTTAVDAASFRIEAGELFFLLGPSGCGKTTLLRMTAGFIDPTSGRILFGGHDVTRVPPGKRNTGMVFQSYALWPHMTVEGNVAFGLDVRKVAPEEKKRRVREALEQVRMAELAPRKPNMLSGGQQQRVALARALVVRPSVLLLDEPLSNLDAKLRIELRSEIRRVCKESGLTTIYVTHDQKEALSMADRVAIMKSGRVEQIGSPADLYRAPRTRFVAEFLGETTFLPARISGRDGVLTRLDTPAGPLLSDRDAPHHAAPGAGVVCSVRPEAWRLEPADHARSDGPNRVTGRIVETVYLGEIAQHVVEVEGGGGAKPLRVRVAQINPAAELLQAGLRGEGDHPRVALSVSPGDVVMVSDEA